MNGLHRFTGDLSALVALVWRHFQHAPLPWKLAGLVGVGFFVAVFTAHRSDHSPIVRLNGLSWSRDDFCRGWLITGDTGSGKTRSGINQLLFQVFQNEPRWGGLCIDDKGIYWETLVAMARHFNRERDLVLLQVRPDNARSDWKPTQTYNLTSAPGIPFSTFAKFVVDSASSLGQQNDKGFFKSQVQTHLTLALELIYEIEGDVTLENALNVLLDHKDLEEAMKTLSESHQTQRRIELRDHFIKRYLNQPPEQMGGVRETIGNYLQCFSTPCYLLIPANEYRGPEPRRYTHEGREACFRGEVFKLGPKVVFVATDATVEEWRQMFRTMYADGGWFARHSAYELFLTEDNRLPLNENASAACLRCSTVCIAIRITPEKCPASSRFVRWAVAGRPTVAWEVPQPPSRAVCPSVKDRSRIVGFTVQSSIWTRKSKFQKA